MVGLAAEPHPPAGSAPALAPAHEKFIHNVVTGPFYG